MTKEEFHRAYTSGYRQFKVIKNSSRHGSKIGDTIYIRPRLVIEESNCIFAYTSCGTVFLYNLEDLEVSE